jgi:hypothetical protein
LVEWDEVHIETNINNILLLTGGFDTAPAAGAGVRGVSRHYSTTELSDNAINTSSRTGFTIRSSST